MSKHITGHTGLLCLLGSPVAHSVSPEMHNEACDQLGLDYTYLAFDVPEDKMPEAVRVEKEENIWFVKSWITFHLVMKQWEKLCMQSITGDRKSVV